MAFIYFNSQNLAQAPLPILGSVGSFALTNQQSQIFNQSQLDGKVWIANFIFTHCAGPCPMMSAVMRRFTEQLADEEKVRFVSFSVDPVRDTPEKLRQYGEKYHADPEKWFFLTGDRDKIYDLALSRFRLAVGDAKPEMRSPHTILHSTKFTLVDSKGRIRGYYDSGEPFQLKALVRDAKRLTWEGSHDA